MEDIDSWLTALGLEQYIEAFRKEELDLQGLVLLSEHDLKDIGLPLGQRKRLLNASASLHPTAHDSAPAERRNLTILICDYLASTEHADSRAPGEFRPLREKIDNR